MNQQRNSHAGTGATYTSAFAIGGQDTAPLANTEEWNGVTWTEVADINTSREALRGGRASNSPAAIVFGGQTPGTGELASTEEWSSSSTVTKTVDAS